MIVRQHPVLKAIMERWDFISLPDCWLSGSAIAQAVWNHTFNLDPEHGLADVDLVYFDAADLSEAHELGEARRVTRHLSDVPMHLDVKNQARVHVWYALRFGYPIPPYRSVTQAISTFPTTSAAIGIRPGSVEALEIFAPFGLSDLLKPIVRPNQKQITKEIYEAKRKRWRTNWPKLQFVDWMEN